MKSSLYAAVALLIAATPALHAQSSHDGHAGHGSGAAATAAQAADGSMTAAEVRRVDREARRITLKHEEIRTLDMPPMTMVFQVRETALLDGLQAGDRVRFAAQKIDGAYVVTAIAPAR